MFALPVLEHLKRLQRAHNVDRVYCSLLADLCKAGSVYVRAETHIPPPVPGSLQLQVLSNSF